MFMCGRFSQLVGSDILIQRYQVDVSRHEHNIKYNIGPTSNISVILKENPIVLTTMRWGLVTNNRHYNDNMINVRSEKMFVNKLYESAMNSSRCIVPVSGFYEWKAAEKFNEKKTPYYIKLKDDDSLSFAAIYSTKTMINKFLKPVDPEKNILKNVGPVPVDPSQSLSCAILTTSPNQIMTPIHDRMPVIIKKEDEKRWLDPEVDPKELADIFEPFPADLMEAYPVSTFVNSTRNNTEKCITRADPNAIIMEQRGLDVNQGSLDDFF